MTGVLPSLATPDKPPPDKPALTPKLLEVGLVDVNSKIHNTSETGSFKDRARWNPIDWLLGTKPGQFLSLILLAVAINIFGALMWMTTEGNESYDTSFSQAMWFSWGMFFDPGTQMGFASTDAQDLKALAIFFSIIGFCFNLVFLGLIVDVVRTQLEYFRKSRSRIVANDHTLILGWSRRTLFLIAQLLQSMENRGMKSQLVILAEEDEYLVMQELIRQFPDLGIASRVSVRNGSPSECDDLMHVSVLHAREIIILANPGVKFEADLDTVRSIIAIAALPSQPKGPVIAEVRDPATTLAIRTVLDSAEGIYVKNAIRRVLCLTAIYPAAGDTFQILMSWLEGSEIYVKSRRELGAPQVRTIGQAQELLEKGIIIGVRPHGHHSIMAPPLDMELQDSDKLLIIADALTDICFSKKAFTFPKKPAAKAKAPGRAKLSVADVARSVTERHQTKTVIIVGWPNDIDDVLTALADYLAPGSKVVILASINENDRQERLNANRALQKTDLVLTHVVGNITSVYSLAELPLKDASAILVLADDGLDEQPRKADSASLQAAINIDSLMNGHYPELYDAVEESKQPRLVCEILSADTERALRGSRCNGIGVGIQYFHSGVMETGLFTMVSSQTPVFNAMVMMLQPNDYGDLMVLPMSTYVDPALMSQPTMQFAQCFDYVRKTGDVLVGVVQENEHGDSVRISCCRAEAPPVDRGSHFVVVSKRLAALRTQARSVAEPSFAKPVEVKQQEVSTPVYEFPRPPEPLQGGHMPEEEEVVSVPSNP